MEYYSLMLVVDAASPVRRFRIAKSTLRRFLIGCGFVAALFAVGLWDYTRLRADNVELGSLRVEVAEQREQIQSFESTLSRANAELDQVRELERKVRIIANLPGAAGVGGEGVTELAPPADPELPREAEARPPAGVPVHRSPFGATDVEPLPGVEKGTFSPDRVQEGMTSPGARHVRYLASLAESATLRADERNDSLTLLLGELEDKRRRLASMPSVWPAKGWLTSRFGPRISPFTGRRQHHAGIDIAARLGTSIRAPARGRVSSIGSRGPLGNSLTLDHGFGVKTFYGHTDEILVGVGDTVDRGQEVATIGNSGRSTGPHLHYAVHVNGKARNPLDYIFD